MVAPDPKQQKSAFQRLLQLFSQPSTVSAIHYSCESFYDRPDGSSPRITAIAICNLESQQTLSFSIHRIAEREHVEFEDITSHYDELEARMLSEFLDYLRNNPDTKYLHWNMRDENYGFQAIAHRMRVLSPDTSDIFTVPESQKFDLARILKDIYGPTYVGDPRMQKLLEKNEMVPQDFLTGQKEAIAFVNQEYTSLYLSTLSKAKAITEIANLARRRKLKTNTSFWHMHGGAVRTAIAWPLEHPLVSSLIGLAGVILAVLGLFWN